VTEGNLQRHIHARSAIRMPLRQEPRSEMRLASVSLTPGCFELPAQFVFPSEVTRRKMKRHGSPDCGGSRDLARSPRGEVSLAFGVLSILIEEHGLDEQQISAAKEACKSFPVAWIVRHIGHIADLLSGYELQHLGLQLAERDDPVSRTISRAPVNCDRGIVGRTCAHLFLESGEPLPRR